MKILVVLTGGTIGSKLDSGIISVAKPENLMLISMYRQKYGDNEDFEVVAPLNVLSENMTASVWQKLLDFLYSVNTENYDGIIITHGSDTLSYTASMLGIALCGLKIPVVLVASNYVLTDSRANGVDNFYAAVEFIKNSGLTGVYVSYKNSDTCEIYLSTKIVKADCYLDKFKSFDEKPLCRVTQSGVFFNKKLPDVKRGEENIIISNGFKNKVAVISPYPSLDYDMFSFSDDVKAVLHLTYHSGTACIQEKNSVLEFIKRCKQSDIDVYFSSLKSKENVYDTTAAILSAGGKPLYNISEESSYAKLMLCYNQTKEDTQSFMSKNYFYENI